MRTSALEPVGVVDIGSNSGRVMVYRPEPGGHLHILAGSRASLRLVRELDGSGRVAEDALERLYEALADFRSIARGSGVTTIVAAGTSALRDAANGPEFARRVRRELGFEIRILSGVEEARYGFIGAVGGLPVANGLLFDLGGGSLQLGRFRARRLGRAVSLPLGALRVQDAFLTSDPPTGGEVRRLRSRARGLIEQAGVGPLREGEQVVGTGGTLRNLARIDQRSAGYPIARLHGHVLTGRRLERITAELLSSRSKKRGKVPGLNPDRRDSILGGALVIEELLRVSAASEILVSGEGVREGLARSIGRSRIHSPQAARLGSLAALTSRFAGWSEDRARRREAAAAALVRALDRGASDETVEMLRHAARILDVGRTVDFFDRHGHAADLALATDLAGFSHRQLAILAAVLRQAGDEDETPRSLEPLVERADRKPIERAAVLLALADEITERCPPGSRPALRVCLRGEDALVSVPALMSFAARGLGARFRRAFKLRLRVVAGRG